MKKLLKLSTINITTKSEIRNLSYHGELEIEFIHISIKIYDFAFSIRVCNKSNTTRVTRGVGTAYPPGAH